MTIILEKSRKATILSFMNQGNVLQMVNNLIEPQRSFTSVFSGTPYNLEKYKGNAIDIENMVISVPIWASNILETDEFSKKVTTLLLNWQDENDTHFWDYNIEQFLLDNGIEIDSVEYSDYTYNDCDYNRLDRDIHYTVFKYDCDYYVCFSVHHGADARIGFSDSIVLAIKDECVFDISMQIQVFERESDMDYQWYELDEIATYNSNDETWYLNDSNLPLSVYSSADGF